MCLFLHCSDFNNGEITGVFSAALIYPWKMLEVKPGYFWYFEVGVAVALVLLLGSFVDD